MGIWLGSNKGIPRKSLGFKRSSEVVYNIRVSKYFSPWDIFWSEGIETFLG